MLQQPASLSTRGTQQDRTAGAAPIPRAIFLTGGYVSLGMGLVGVVLPLWPTTCFILLSAWCFARSSPAMHRWLHENRLFGAQLRLYRDHGAITLGVRNGSLLMLWSAIGLSILLVAHMVWLQLILLAIAAAVSLHLVKLPSQPSRALAGPRLGESRPTHAWNLPERPR